MDRMTREQMLHNKIKQWRDMPHWRPSWIAPLEWEEFCDLALQSLSLESVREEARNAVLEEAARECGICASRQAAKHDQKVRDQTRRDLASAIRALQSTARVAEGERKGDSIATEMTKHGQAAKALLAEVFDDRGCRVVNHDGSRVVTPQWVERATDCLCGRLKK